MYCPRHPYLLIGDHDRRFLFDLDIASACKPIKESKDLVALLSLVTLFQYTEHLSDVQAAQATGQRVDWKYALHLPLPYPGLAPSSLCMFRQWMSREPQCPHLLTKLIETCSLLGLSLASPQGLPEPGDILGVNCLKNCLDLEIGLMLPAMEALAAEQPAWLQSISLPHWYTRYITPHHSLFQASSREELIETLTSLEGDIDHLVRSIRALDHSNFNHYPEIRALLASWKEEQQPNLPENPVGSRHAYPIDCSTCIYPQQIHLFSEGLIS